MADVTWFLSTELSAIEVGMLNVTYALDFSVKSLHCIDNCSILKGPYSEGHDQKTNYNGVKIVKKKKHYGGTTFF